MIRHDIECRRCEYRKIDYMFNHHSTLKKEEIALICPKCGSQKEYRITFDTKRPGQINNTSSIYGRSQPCFGGEIVRDYAHKQQLLKKYNMVEANDPVKGSREPDYPEGYNGPGQQHNFVGGTKVADNVVWGNSPAELDKAMEAELERLHSGGSRGDTPVEDHWG